MRTIVIYHRADFDGIFCREIAKKFLPDADFIGWDFGDAPLSVPTDGTIYVMDLPVDKVFGCEFKDGDILKGDWIDPKERKKNWSRFVWIDHHKSSIATHPTDIPGYRIDGVAACRLAWQWFTRPDCKHCKGNGFVDVEKSDRVEQDDCGFCSTTGKEPLPEKSDFIDREVLEPLAVRLAGEYDIWDKRDPRAELFQHGLRSRELFPDTWLLLLSHSESTDVLIGDMLKAGRSIQYASTQQNESIIKAAGFDLEFEGLRFLACNHARYNSHLFIAGLRPDHDACFGFCWRDGKWTVSLYHAPGKERHDLSQIAVKYGGGGHKGACGFRIDRLPFLP